MRYLILALLLLIGTVAYAANNTRTPGVLIPYSTSKPAACTKGSLAHSRTQIFICYSTGKWKGITGKY